MSLICFQVLSRKCLGALVDLTFFGTDEEHVLLELVEIEAETAGETDKGAFFISTF